MADGASLPELLVEMFDGDELRVLIADHFAPAAKHIPEQPSQLQIAQALLTFCCDTNQGEQLYESLVAAREARRDEINHARLLIQLQAFCSKVDGPRVQMPVPDFVGRQELFKQLERALSPDAVGATGSVCCLYGMTGIGKTQIARSFAQQMRAIYRDGQIYVALGDLPAGPMLQESALRRVLSILEPDNSYESSPGEILASMFLGRLEGRRYLIIADDASSPQQVEPLVPPPGSSLLVICRNFQALGSFAAASIEAPPLNDDEAAQFLQANCAQLNPHDAYELARLCSNVPLALRLASSTLAPPNPYDVPAYLRDLRAHGADMMLAPGFVWGDKLSVKAALRASYDLLSRSAQRGLAHLSILPPVFDRQAVEAVLSPLGATNRVLKELLGGSLLAMDPTSGQFTMHSLVRSFAAKRLLRKERVKLAASHARYYAAVSRALLEESQHAWGELAAQRRVRDEWLHFAAAWEWAVSAAGEPETDELFVTVVNCAMTFGAKELLLNRQPPLLQHALALAARLGRDDLQLRLALCLGDAHVATSEGAAAIGYYEEALQLARKLGNLDAEAGAALGAAATAARSDPPQTGYALMLYGWAFAAAEASGDRRSISRALRGLGNAEVDRGALFDALDHYTRALDLIGDEDALLAAAILLDCGNAHLLLAFGKELPVIVESREWHIGQAESYYWRSARVARDAGMLREALEAIYSLAQLRLLQLRHEEAEATQRACASIERMLDAGDIAGATGALRRLAPGEGNT